MHKKPIEAPKKPENAPFLLPSLSTLSGERILIPNSINGDSVQNEIGIGKTISQAVSKKAEREFIVYATSTILHSDQRL